MGTYYALQKRSGLQFAAERIKRLFIPLIFGMIFIVPPQVYFERLDKGEFHGNYFEYWPAHAFDGLYPEGNISWHHLWFILYLLIFSLLLTPVFVYLKNHPDTWIIKKIKQAGSTVSGLYLFIIPLFIWRITLAHKYPQTNGLINDWYNLINYCSLFFSGFLLISIKDVFWTSVTKNRLLFLINGILGFSLLTCLWDHTGDFSGKQYISDFVKVFNLWSWILALSGYSSAYLNKPSKVLAYANEAVYPFYILHQTIIIALGYYLKNAELSFFPKFTLMVIGTFGISWIIYEFGIRRYALIRPLFGMKPRSPVLKSS
jgi:hypothetical protein